MTPKFDIQQNWQESPHLAVLAPLSKCSKVSKIRGHPNRTDFIYLSDELGYLTLFRWNTLKNTGEQILFDSEPFTDSWLNGDFCLHPHQPWVIYTKDEKGNQYHSIHRLNYELGKTTYLVSDIGTCSFLLPYDQNTFIVVVNTQKDNRILRISYKEGKTSPLFSTDNQILSIAASEKYQTVVASVGRKSSELIFIDVSNQNIRNILSETETSKDTWITMK